MPNLDVSLSPQLYHLCKQENTIVVVIDVLRATSAICTAFEHGVEKVIPVSTIEEAQAYKDKGYLVGAERDGQKVEGFDFGNSPYSYMGANIKDKAVVLTTTNGTKAINMASNAHKVVVGAFTNITALCKWLITEQKDVVLLCSGWKDRYNLEDTLFAGAVVNYLQKNGGFDDATDAALSSKYLYQTAKSNPAKFLRNSSHRRRLAKLNLKEDIKYCLTLDQSSVIPILKDNVLVRLVQD